MDFAPSLPRIDLDGLRRAPIRIAWDTLSPLPGGTRLFSRLVGEIAPYTGTLGAHVVELRSGFAKVELRERRRLRNHLESVHAMALANLGELTTGLAMMYDFPEDARGIVTAFEVRYLKKARGRLTATCETTPVTTSEEQEKVLEGVIRNPNGEVACTVTATWLIRPKA
ncbi:MAG: DUF4442 domain-containing protein [Deltaproteobacteria bacterium]|nr:MAG: DUF4442 domain-containing protein [Deltaproteobacteria bacterium]